MLGRYIVINTICALIVIGAAYLLDQSLELGQLHGVALRLYGFIGIGILLIANVIVTLKQKNTHILIAGLSVCAISAVIVYFIS